MIKGEFYKISNCISGILIKILFCYIKKGII